MTKNWTLTTLHSSENQVHKQSLSQPNIFAFLSHIWKVIQVQHNIPLPESSWSWYKPPHITLTLHSGLKTMLISWETSQMSIMYYSIMCISVPKTHPPPHFPGLTFPKSQSFHHVYT